MHLAVLGATGYTLLLSSLIMLVILIRKGCQHKKKSPFYMLSMSDIFSAILTAVILLVNHIEGGIKLSYSWQNNTSVMSNRAWTIENIGEYQLPFPEIHNLREAVDEVDFNVTLSCDTKDVFMQYGMLLATLTNAFISLLTFIIQCNINAACIKKKCASIMKSLANNTQLELKNAEVKRRGSRILKDEHEPVFEKRNNIGVKNSSSLIRRIMKILKFQTSKEDDKKPVSFFVTSHWLMPFIVVGMLYFAEYNDMNVIRHIEDAECIFESNFPMNDFYIFSNADDNLETVDSIIHTIPLEDNYFVNEDLSNKSKLNIEVNQIVSKVQNIVRTALNNARNSTEDTESIHFLNDFISQNMTEYITTNNITSYIRNNINIDSITQRLNSTLTEQNISFHNSSSNTNNNNNNNNNIHFNQDPEISLFHDSLNNASEELNTTTLGSNASQMSTSTKDDSYQKDAQIYFASTGEDTTQMIIDTFITENSTSISNNEIYDEIMKRIEAASAYTAKQNNTKGYITKRKPNSIKDLFSDKTDDFNHYISKEMHSSPHMTNECLVSTKFLKLHLFILSFAIYFLPILFSCILQMQGKHMCKNTYAIVKAKTDFMFTLLSSNATNSSVDNNAAIVNKSHSEFCVSTDNKRTSHENSIEDLNTSQELRSSNKMDIETISNDCESYRLIENERMLLEIDCMVKIFNTIKTSLIICIILWTPVFLETLLRVFSCIRAPQWLTDITFLSAISFSIIRNALNLSIIKIQETSCNTDTKENKIHPIK